MRLFFLLFFGFATLSARAADKPVIQWHYLHYPPTYIAEGPDAGQGFADHILGWLEERMPEFEHVHMLTAMPRTFAELKSRDDVCIAGIYKTAERETYITFSHATVATPANRVIVMKDKADRLVPYLNEKGEIRLPDLLADAHLSAGVISDRIYSPTINAALAAAPGSEGRVQLPHPGYAKLLERGRFDYTFGYPYEAAYGFRALGQPDAFMSFPIEGESLLVEGYIGCSKSALGRAVIDRVDTLAAEAGNPPAYQHFIEAWLDPAARRDYQAALLADAVKRR